jgi:hypothetical protein
MLFQIELGLFLEYILLAGGKWQIWSKHYLLEACRDLENFSYE